MRFPRLTPGQFAVLQAEVATGIVLNLDGVTRHTGTGEVFRIFDSLDAAQAFAWQIVRVDPKLECGIYDADETCFGRIVAEQ